MFILVFVLSILEAKADQPVIQYDTIEDAHLAAPHINKLRLEKQLVILPKVSHEVQYLSNPFRREVDDGQSTAPSLPTASALRAAPPNNIFTDLNLNYEIPSYSTPEDFQNSVNSLTHMMINKQSQVKFPGTSYGVPVTDSPQHVEQSTVSALVNMLIGLDKEKQQKEMLSQIVQFMHKKKMQQEQQTLIAQLQHQMQKEQYKPFLQSREQAEGLIHFMQQLLQPLKQHGLGSLPVQSTPVPNIPKMQSPSPLAAQFDWTPSKLSFVQSSSPNFLPTAITYQQTQHQFSPAPTKPTYAASASTSSHSFAHASAPAYHEKEGYVIRLSKPTIMKEELPLSTVMPPKVVHHYMHQHKGSSSHKESDMFAPKYEHYIVKHQNGEKSKPQLIKLNEDHKFHESHSSSTKYLPKHHQFDVGRVEHEFSNGLNKHHSKRHHHNNQNHEAIDDDHRIAYDFVHSNNDDEHDTHIHTPYTTFNNHEFDQEFLKDFDNMHFKEENIPDYEEVKKPRKHHKPTTKAPQKYIVLKKITKH